jgi:NDP-sugar pyrophosphorylase family protein
MKALILAAGRGKRINGLSGLHNKCLLRVNNKPLIEYSLDYARLHKFSGIVIVVGYKGKDIIKKYRNNYKGMPIDYVWQKKQKGIVDAIECAENALIGEDFMLMLGDEILLGAKHKAMIKKFKKEKLFAICGVIIVEDKNLIKNTYSVVQDKNHRIKNMIEKPQHLPNNIMGTGICLFKNAILSYINKTPINPIRKQKDMVDLIMCAINDNKLVKSISIGEKFFNINFEENFKEAKEYLGNI